ncbi:MAG: YqgE/AlgH family protein [Colwellia sp.]|nr:YqgE/AlgH family protein [Colwellia sp.]
MNSLENQLLIAMPTLGDPYFNKTVTYICEHNDEGAMGLIINVPVNLNLNELLAQLEDDEDSQDLSIQNEHTDKLQQCVLSGGPVAQERGFVLHSPQNCWNSSLSLTDDIMITTSKDILLALGTEAAPENFVVTLGYAGWGPGQLEEELKSNSWLTTPADKEILFNTPIEQRWKKATENIGIDIAHLSADIGHA